MDDIDVELVLTEAHLHDDGSLQVRIEAIALQNEAPVSDGGNRREQDSVQATPEAPNDEDSQGDHVDRDSREDRAMETELPAYRDPYRLRTVYDQYETFREMRDALEVDVTPQTVRRYMIKHSIHKSSSETNSDSVRTLLDADPDALSASKDDSDAPSSPTERDSTTRSTTNECESDGLPVVDGGQVQAERGTTTEGVPEGSDVELPDHLDIEAVKEVVRNAKTIYEVQCQMEMSREATRELLTDLNLLDLVQGRLGAQRLEEQTIDEIDRRIRSATVS